MKVVNMKNDDYMIGRIIAFSQCWRNGQIWEYSAFKRPDHGLYIVIQGKCEYLLNNGKIISCNPGDVLYIPKEINYTVRFFHDACNGENFCRTLLINFCIKDSDGNEASFSESIEKVYFDQNGEAEKLYKNIIELYKQNMWAEIKRSFFDLIIKICEKKTVKDFDLTHLALQYVNSHFAEPLRIDEIAKKYAMSETVFRKKFKELTGQSPVKYINSLRILKSKELLGSSEITIDTIADFLSFYDKAHFCKAFKSATGISPYAYRKKKL